MKKKLSKNGKIFVFVVCIFVVVLVVIALLPNMGDKKAIDEGRNYLKSLEKGNVNTVKSKIDEQNKKDEIAQARKMLAEKTTDQNKIWSSFKDYVLIGDSRVETFNVYLPKSNVLAKKGARIETVDGYLPTIKSLNPKYVFICFGLNDASIPVNWNEDKYVAKYESYLKKIQNVVPNATIYVNSILPVQAGPMKKHPFYSHLANYNVKLKAMCERDHYKYIDLSDLVETYPDGYEPDGEHFKVSFYKYWGYRLLQNIYGG
ncbi:MAG: GDSL-type esterase/lipase family protein [Sharpea porci]|uniref:GDSL-type esterase/lipase family protein n=1 Tax=Sharpea porci TaxID=2652286 RepID=UPI00240A8DD3|nr:GDSL-type esterase/lipase family protein [Sharpea porci]MDD6712382.1 GDSL-type esterase/lipase family protein [Sharpea porci]